MYTNNYSNTDRFDKVTAKFKWFSFFCLTVYMHYKAKQSKRSF